MSVIVDFIRFKREYEGRHMDLVGEIGQNEEALRGLTETLGSLIDLKCEVEKARTDIAEKENAINFSLDEVTVESETLAEQLANEEAIEEELRREEEQLEAELK